MCEKIARTQLVDHVLWLALVVRLSIYEHFDFVYFYGVATTSTRSTINFVIISDLTLANDFVLSRVLLFPLRWIVPLTNSENILIMNKFLLAVDSEV